MRVASQAYLKHLMRLQDISKKHSEFFALSLKRPRRRVVSRISNSSLEQTYKQNQLLASKLLDIGLSKSPYRPSQSKPAKQFSRNHRRSGTLLEPVRVSGIAAKLKLNLLRHTPR